MSTATVHTPLRNHGTLFNTRTAGGRMPLTPSPSTRRSNNVTPCTPPRRTKNDSIYPGNLASHFAALQLSSKKQPQSSPKTNIAKKAASPIRLDLGISEWTLTGSGTTNGETPVKSSATKSRKSKTTIRVPQGDRFIPTRPRGSPVSRRVNMNRPGSSGSNGSQESVLDSSVFGPERSYNSSDEEEATSTSSSANENIAYQSSVAEAVGLNLNTRILAFKPTAPESSKPIDLRSQYNRPLKPSSSAQFRRRILTAPDRVLDAPGLVDDYYLNLLDWSSSNQIAIGLERSVYVWNGETGTVTELCETRPDTYVASVKWSQDGAHIAIGLGTGDVQIWDAEDGTKLRTMSGHDSRVASLSWNRGILSSGARSGLIYNHDVRIAQHKVAELVSHTSEVCGLEWRSDGAQLASGGNDNLVNIWDARSLEAPKWTKTNHKAAVKALAWCPWQLNLLATGGGSYDRNIHFWNSTTGARVNSIDTGSQVTSLRWSTHYREIVSCHGFPDNQLSIWSYPSLVRNVEIPAHETRVLHSCLSPDGQTLATAASDESLKFWKIFERKAGSASASSTSSRDGEKMERKMTIR